MSRRRNGGRKKGCLTPIIVIFLLLFIVGAFGGGDENVSATDQAKGETIVELVKMEETVGTEMIETVSETIIGTEAESVDLADIPEFTGKAYVEINDNVPAFSDADMTSDSFEIYSALDAYGRCGAAYANVGKDVMPTKERSRIGEVKPSGWHTVKYDNVDGKYLYNRCHLIGYQLTGENANEENLITGTRYMNVVGMLPFENMVADYVKETGNHVLYRVTPIYEGDNLVASGVQMEAKSVEDDGEDILFNVFCYNVQPGISIDYATGDSQLLVGPAEAETEAATEEILTETEAEPVQDTGTTYILNTSTKKFHYPDCSSVKQMKDKNKEEYTGSRDDLIADGYEPCKRCTP